MQCFTLSLAFLARETRRQRLSLWWGSPLLLHSFAARSSKALAWSSTQACLCCIFEASLGSIPPFYAPVCYAGAVWAARSHPGLEPTAGKPLVVPQWRHSQHTEQPSWSWSWKSCPGAGAKVGKLPQFTGCSTEHPSPAAGQPHGNPKSSPASRPSLQREAPSCTDSMPPSSPIRGGITVFSICIIIQNISPENEFLCKQELNSLVDRISKNKQHGTAPTNSKSKIHIALGNGGLEPQPAHFSLQSAALWGFSWSRAFLKFIYLIQCLQTTCS